MCRDALAAAKWSALSPALSGRVFNSGDTVWDPKVLLIWSFNKGLIEQYTRLTEGIKIAEYF